MSDFVSDVKAFHERFGVLTQVRPHVINRGELGLAGDLIDEENNELDEVWHTFILDPTPPAKDWERMAKEIVDVIYAHVSAAVRLGIPLDRVWAEVHRTNMLKEADPDGGKVRKPEGWRPPDIAAALWGDEK